MRGKPTVYFLGAGASVDAEVPVTRNLLALIERRRRHRGGALYSFIRTFGFSGVVESGRLPIVEAISLLDSCLREERPLDRHFTLERMRKIRTELVIDLAHVLQPSASRHRGVKVQIPSDAYDQPGTRGRRIARYIRKFARSIQPGQHNDRQKQGDTIITTNYDTNIDVALFEIAYGEGTSQESPDIEDVFLGAGFRDPYDDEPAFTETTNTVSLLKLHGSLNWLYCQRCSRIFIAAFGQSVLFLNRRRDPWEQTCYCGYENLQPVIVAPSIFQEISNPHLQRIWMNAYQALESASHWVFVGYSLPAEDLAVRSLLYRALQGKRFRDGSPPSVLVICLPTDAPLLRRRYRGLLGNRVRVVEQRFKEYVDAT